MRAFAKDYLYTRSLATAKGLPPASAFPAKGRGTPDVSALGEGYQVIVGGHVESVGGTSASSPAFAGLVSLLNDARDQKGMKPMGFLNPFLYHLLRLCVLKNCKGLESATERNYCDRPVF